jgi:hypothetical protein
MDLPVLKKAELEQLDAFYPEKCADPKDTDRDIWGKVGQREVILRLIHEYRRAQEKKG